MSSETNDQGILVPPVLDTRPFDIRSSASRKHKRTRPSVTEKNRTNGMVTSPRTRSKASKRHPLSPRDGTQIIVNGQTVDRNSIDPIVIPSPLPSPMLRPASPRAAVPGISSVPHSPRGPFSPNSQRRSPSRLVPRSPERTFISPASPTTFIPAENPAITKVGSHVGPFVPSISSIRSPVQSPKRGLSEEKITDDKLEEDVEGVDKEKTEEYPEDDEEKTEEHPPEKEKEDDEEKTEEHPPENNSDSTDTSEDKTTPQPDKSRAKSKRRKKKKSHKYKTYKSTVPPFLGPVLNVPQIPDYNSMTPIEQAQWREEFRVKFGLLRSAFRDFSIPAIDPQEPLEMVHARYERYIRHIHISGAADSYRNYLILMFLVIELLATQVLGLPCNGYTMAQMRSMSKYEQLLIQLGEKWYVPGGSDWPVEYRIIFLALFNALVFMGMKYLSQYVGGEGAAESIINFIIGGNVNNDNPSSSPESGDGGGGGGGGGFDLGSLMGLVNSVLGNNGNNANTSFSAANTQDGGGEERRRRRGPLYRE